MTVPTFLDNFDLRAEQKRIVAKVNELMALCDALEAKLTRSRADADTLAAAVVHQMCNSGVRRANFR